MEQLYATALPSLCSPAMGANEILVPDRGTSRGSPLPTTKPTITSGRGPEE